MRKKIFWKRISKKLFKPFFIEMIRCITKGPRICKFDKYNFEWKDVYIFVYTTNANKCEKAC